MRGGSFLWSLAGIIALLLLWELGARLAGSLLIFPGPLPVLRRLWVLARTKSFLLALGSSFLRIIFGMLISVPLGIAAGIASGLDKRAGAMLRPLFSVVAATPVMSVILIAFLALGQERTPVFTAFLMVFPVMAANTAQGIHAADPELKELFRVYKISAPLTLKYFYFPSVLPFILGALRSSLSLCWKVVVAAEVLVQPLVSLGRGMQAAKAQLETAELFAWTLATVCAAAFTQFLLTLVLRFFKKHRALYGGAG
ncbi:ABC transporter permease [Spirochaetia bacterium]|nr:ABC transporter permease [Spirochaetia bacterium]